MEIVKIIRLHKDVDLRSIHKYRKLKEVDTLAGSEVIMFINTKKDKVRLIDCKANCYNLYCDKGLEFSIEIICYVISSGFGVQLDMELVANKMSENKRTPPLRKATRSMKRHKVVKVG